MSCLKRFHCQSVRLAEFRLPFLAKSLSPDPDFSLPSIFFNLRFNTAGQTAFQTAGAGSQSSGIFSRRPGESLKIVALEDDQFALNNSDISFGTFFNIGLSESGQITFGTIDSSTVVGFPTLNTAIFSHNAGILAPVVQPVVQPGDPVPSLETTTLVDVTRFLQGSVDNLVHSVNAAGQIAFAAEAQQTVTNSRVTGIFTTGTAGVNPIVLSGDQVSNAAEGVEISDFGSGPMINAAGETAFSAYVSGPSLDQPTFGIFSAGLGVLNQIALDRQQAPGVEQGVVFEFFEDAPFFSPPKLAFNDAGHVAFISALDEGSGTSFPRAIFSDASGSLQLVARVNEQVPGAENGIRFGGLSRVNLNNEGQVAFLAQLIDDNGELSGSAIYATDLDGQLVEVVRTGGLIDVDEDPLVEDLRTVSLLQFTPNRPSTSSRSFNNRGQLAFSARFTDSSEAIIVSDRVASLPVLLGDSNQDGVVNFADIASFISILSAAEFLPEADINRDGIVDFSDISPFILILVG